MHLKPVIALPSTKHKMEFFGNMDTMSFPLRDIALIITSTTSLFAVVLPLLTKHRERKQNRLTEIRLKLLADVEKVLFGAKELRRIQAKNAHLIENGKPASELEIPALDIQPMVIFLSSFCRALEIDATGFVGAVNAYVNEATKHNEELKSMTKGDYAKNIETLEKVVASDKLALEILTEEAAKLIREIEKL